MPIALVNLNRIRIPPIAPYALDVLASALEREGEEVHILDLCPEADPIAAIDAYFSAHDPKLVGLSLRNVNDMYFPSYFDLPTKGSFLDSHRTLVDAIRRYVGPERIIVGGVGFSTNPRAVLRRLGLRYGVHGPGEVILPWIARRLSSATLAELTEGAELFVFDGRTGSALGPVSRTYVNNAWYYEYGGQSAIRTSRGCVMHCSYCAEPAAAGRQYGKGLVADVLAQIDQLVERGIRDIQTADSEFNLPLGHSKKMLQAIVERGYPRDLRFWLFCQPKPFDAEYAALLARAGVKGINFGTDHTDTEVLRRLGKWYTLEDVKKTSRLCADNGIAVMHELLLGSPGDTPDKMFTAIEDVLRCEPWVLGVSIGLGVAADAPLGAMLARRLATHADTAGFYFEGEPMTDPTFYLDPSFGGPEIFDRLAQWIGPDRRHIMIPTLNSTGASNNQLVNSERVRRQLLDEKRKGPSWYHYPS
jgi:radical SAM superfamily enzyme YgiQ (UPF0313 family)